MNLNKFINKKGFTLVELSISLIIIALILAAIFSSTSLINNAKLRALLTEVADFEVAISHFEEKFKYLPGDFPQAAVKIGGGIANGNGDWNISKDESLVIARSLYLSNDFKQQYATLAGDIDIGTNIVETSLNSGGLWFVTHQSGLGSNVDSIYGKSSESIDFAAKTDNNNIRNGVIDAKDAVNIDIKIDDGLADSGYIYASVGQDFDDSNGCVDELPSEPAANYVISRDGLSCRLHFWYDRKSQ